MRTFIAIDLNEENVEKIAGLQSELKKSDADVKWVEPENIHLTLKFLGEISEEQAGQVKNILDKIASDFRPFEVSLTEIGAFPKLDYPRVIWVGIEKGKKETEEIAKNIEDELEKLGFPKEKRPFAAHLTIGRVRTPKNKERLKTVIQTWNLEHRTSNSQIVSSVVLYQSKLTPKGPIYTPLHSANFS